MERAIKRRYRRYRRFYTPFDTYIFLLLFAFAAATLIWLLASLTGNVSVATLALFASVGSIFLLIVSALFRFWLTRLLILVLYGIPSACVLGFYLLTGVTDFGNDWADRLSWFFRVPGVILALSILGFIFLLQWRERRKIFSESSSVLTRPPSDLPAAAVSELVDRRGGYRTPITTVLEMIHKGTLRLIADRSGSTQAEDYTYRLAAQPGPKHKWEQALCEGLPQEPLAGPELWRRLNDPDIGIRSHLNEYLQDRGLLNRQRTGWRRNIWTWQLVTQAALLMGVGLILWIPHLWIVWWAGLAIIAVVYVAAFWAALQRLANLSVFTYAGRTEIKRWHDFGERLDSGDFHSDRLADLDGTDPLMPYAVALNHICPWKDHPMKPFAWNDDSKSVGYFNNPKTVGLDAAMIISAVGFEGGGLDFLSGGWLDSSSLGESDFLSGDWIDGSSGADVDVDVDVDL